ncbi:MAG TPA: hypothetical protein VFS11_02060 [Gemmatimonadales bacterium]|nr:hypothetical protein [Gemmatimonadales bacterium]
MRSRRQGGPAVRCRPAQLDDHGAIGALQLRYGLGCRSFAEWSHLWTDNPACRERPGLAIGWVLEDSAGEIIGTLGNIPFLFSFQGRRLVAGTSHAWVVDERYRALAPMLLERFLSQPEVDFQLALYPNRLSEPVIALRCDRVPTGKWDEYAFWITNYRAYAERVVARRAPHPRLARALSLPGALALRLRDRLRTAPVRPGDADVRACVSFDERFDVFWDDFERAHPGLLLAVRSRAVLEWHYEHVRAQGRLWIASVVDGDRIVAYATFDRKNATTMRLVDYQSLAGTTALLPALLHWAIERCRREGFLTLMAVGSWLEPGALLDRIAPHRRRLHRWLYFYHASDPGLAERLRDRHVWAPTLFDGDESLVPHAEDSTAEATASD